MQTHPSYRFFILHSDHSYRIHRCHSYQSPMLKAQQSCNRWPLVGGNCSMDVYPKRGQIFKTSILEASNSIYDTQMDHHWSNKL
eukprot:11416867-Ditylum_brightwellii.AAC.1